jgi:hypothetical protein
MNLKYCKRSNGYKLAENMQVLPEFSSSEGGRLRDPKPIRKNITVILWEKILISNSSFS